MYNRKHKLPTTILMICIIALLGFKDTGIFVRDFISVKDKGGQTQFFKEENIDITKEAKIDYIVKKENTEIIGQAYGNIIGFLNKGEEVAVNCVLRTNLPTEDFTWWELFLYGVRSDLRCWVTIPPEKKPFFVVKRTSGKMFLEAASESVVLPFGELHLLRYERFRAMHGSLYSQELQKGWSPPELQPRVNGVLALWVEWTKANGLFEVWVLTSGGASVFGRTSPPSMWPAAAPWRQEFSLYELYVSRASWQVKNR